MSDAEERNNKQPGEEEDRPTASFTGSAGEQIGPFRIERELGRGAVGVVYLAHDTKLDRSVAIKSLPAEVMENPKARSRFSREARLLASLNHPNIATIYDEFQEAEDVAYLILEYVPGQTLAERIAKKPLKLEETLSIALQIAEAVAAAHEHDVIHRDLKPGNIKITPEGKVKVLDFGLAKALGGEATDQQSTVTEPGRVIGTPAYMSPEQARGKPADKRSDIWSFGCVLYEMLTGRIPFKGETISDTLANILQTDPEWHVLPPTTPANILVLLRRCLEKEPRRRLRDISDIAITIEDTTADLQRSALPTKSVEAGRVKPKAWSRRVLPWLVTGAAVTILVLFTFIIGLKLGRPPEEQEGKPVSLPTAGPIKAIVVLPFENLSGDPEQEYFVDGMTDALSAELGKIKPGTSTDALSITLDVMPTILSVAGIEKPKNRALDGIDLSPVIFEQKALPSRPLYWSSLTNDGVRSEALREGPWKLVVQHPQAAPWIIKNGRAQAEIVIAEKSARSAQLGASELQTYFEKITGCRLDIVTAPTDKILMKIYVGESEASHQVGVNANGLERDAFRIVSGADWLALVGNDQEFTPREPWARHRSQWLNEKQKQWEELAGHPWRNPVGASLYRDYNKQLDIWNLDHRGSLNAVYAFLHDLGVRWYMPGELGEILPETRDIALPKVDRTVSPEFEVRSVSRPLISSSEIEDALWYLRIGANEQYGILHHGQRNLTEHPEQRAAHPEYYVQLANGKRDTESATANACLSSEGFFNETVAFARLMFDHYDLPIVSVMPHDGFTHCQCDLCRDQITLDRGASGLSSDYVWKFVVRVANELIKTHPEKKVFCGAYNNYRLPPLTIDKLPDNVLVQITNGRPIRELDDEIHEYTADLREQWLAKTVNPLSVTLNYTPFTNRGAYRPQYWPHVIARGIQACRNEVWREDVWLSSGKGGLHHPGVSHLNPYVISRFWWDADQNIDELLEEYYRLFYGPAATEMKAFIEYCELEFAKLSTNADVTKKALELFDLASAAAPADSVYGRRIALVDEFLPTLRDRATQINIKRPEGLPEYLVIDMAKDKWRYARDTLAMDGKLEEAFWTAYHYPRPLKDLYTDKKPKQQTRFMARWWKGSLYFGIRCELEEDESPVIGSKHDNDPAIWQGEHLELLIETDKHSYYQIVVNPAGAIIDLDRAVTLKDGKAYEWSSQADVVTHVGDKYWSVELRLPVTPSDEDPLHQIIGNRPFQAKQESLDSGKGSSLAWYFNLYRKRSGTENGETTAFSPLGADTKTFHVPSKFAKIYVR